MISSSTNRLNRIRYKNKVDLCNNSKLYKIRRLICKINNSQRCNYQINTLQIEILFKLKTMLYLYNMFFLMIFKCFFFFRNNQYHKLIDKKIKKIIKLNKENFKE